MTRIICYTTGHVTSTTVCEAFAAGAAGALLASIDPALPGPPLEAVDPACDGFVYGRLRGTLDVIRALERHGRHWLYADNGYLRPSDHAAGDTSGFYKVTRDHFQLTAADANRPVSAAGSARLRALDIEIKPWRSQGREIVICPPIEAYAAVMGFDLASWIEVVRDALARHTDRPVRFRARPRPKSGVKVRPLAEDLADAWALVTHDSNVVVEATVLGIPCFVTGESPAQWLGNVDLARIETPILERDRAAWLAHLAANQWTLAEMRDGTCWRQMKEIYQL